MNRKFRTLGISLMAVFAMSAVAASTASAEQFLFTSEIESTTLTGSQSGASKLTVNGGTFECEKGKYAGTMSAKEAVEFDLTPTLEGCTSSLGTVEVAMHGCAISLVPGTKEGTTYEGEATILCEESGNKIAFIAKKTGETKCTVEIGEQAHLKTVTFENLGTPTDVKAKLKLSSMTYSQVAGTGTGACAKAENATNGSFEATVEVKGFEGATQKKVDSEPLPQTVKIKNTPIKLAGLNSTTTFEVENVVNESVKVLGFFVNPAVQTMKKCQTLAKMGDKCTEEVKCVKPTKVDLPIAVFTDPFGGSKTYIEGC